MSIATAAPMFATKPLTRLLSIDFFRGLTVAFMILVNNNGNNDLAYRALNHSTWNGFTPTDLVFPTFLFIMGISMVLSFSAHRAKGTTNAEMFPGILRRLSCSSFGDSL
ncbi:MAG TPA: heparan-alpha-glucosaminide N-acetyltransferase domain-containing protein [Edaphobacter sp.]|nr:heparan-alpha-glucosaminide N-acetyltransferase domain-containing protein [Edaphobacter sp.]